MDGVQSTWDVGRRLGSDSSFSRLPTQPSSVPSPCDSLYSERHIATLQAGQAQPLKL